MRVTGAMTSALTLWLLEFCWRRWSCWDFPSRCCWRLLCYRICSTSDGTLDWSNTGWAPPSGKTPSGLRDNAVLKKGGAEIECPTAISVSNLENQFYEKRRVKEFKRECALLEDMFEAGKSVLDLDSHWTMEFLWSPAGGDKSHQHVE